MSFEAILWWRALGILKFQTIYLTKNKTTNLETKKNQSERLNLAKKLRALLILDFAISGTFHTNLITYFSKT